MKDSRFDHEKACSHLTVHSRLGLHRSKHQLLNAGSLELGKASLQNRPKVAKEENRSERVTLLLSRRSSLLRLEALSPLVRVMGCTRAYYYSLT
jgi:hypothetical protein